MPKTHHHEPEETPKKAQTASKESHKDINKPQAHKGATEGPIQDSDHPHLPKHTDDPNRPVNFGVGPIPIQHKHDCVSFASGDKVRYKKTGATCYVQGCNEDLTYSVVTDDQKHCFNADAGDLELLCCAADLNKVPPAKREPRG